MITGSLATHLSTALMCKCLGKQSIATATVFVCRSIEHKCHSNDASDVKMLCS